MNYNKYYNLEDYLFGEVGPNFRKTGALSIEDFFCIVIWKSNRAKTKIREKMKNGPEESLTANISALAKDIHTADSNEGRLKDVLMQKWRFSLPMASAILTVLYPEDYTVYDYRVCGGVGIKGEITTARRYFDEFLPEVIRQGDGETLREKDKYLWGRSFYRDLQKLISE